MQNNDRSGSAYMRWLNEMLDTHIHILRELTKKILHLPTFPPKVTPLDVSDLILLANAFRVEYDADRLTDFNYFREIQGKIIARIVEKVEVDLRPKHVLLEYLGQGGDGDGAESIY